jgi:glyoxylate carboligase
MMITMKSKIALAATLALGLLVATPMVTAADDAVATAITEAKAAQKKAASVGGEWKGVGKFIKKAEAAAKGGDAKKALKLAKKAKFQSEAGYKQAKNQEELAKEFPDYLK